MTKDVSRFCFISHNPSSWSCPFLIHIRVLFYEATDLTENCRFKFISEQHKTTTTRFKEVFCSSWIGQLTWSSKFTSCLFKKICIGRLERFLFRQLYRACLRYRPGQFSVIYIYIHVFVFKWLKFLFASLLKARKWTYHLLNKRPSYLFEKPNCKFRMNFCEIVTKSTCKKLLNCPLTKNYFLK